MRDVPRTLVIGMAAAIIGSTMRAIATITDTHVETAATLRTALVMIAMLLMAVAYVIVATRIAGWRRGVMLAVAALQLGWLGWLIARPYVGPFDEWIYRAIVATLWWSGIVLLTIAARAWWRASVWVVIAAVLAVVLEALPWAPYLAPVFHGAFEGRPILEELAWPVRELVTSGAIIVLVRGVLR